MLLAPTTLFVGYVLEAIWREAGAVADSTAKRAWLIVSFLVGTLSVASMPIVMLMSAHVKCPMALWGSITGVLGVIGLLAVMWAALGNYRRALVTTIALAVISLAVVGLAVKPLEDGTKPGEALLVKVRGLVGDRPVVVYGHRGCSQLTREEHAIVLYLRSGHPVSFVGNAIGLQKLRVASPDAVIFAPESARDELTPLNLGVRHEMLRDTSGGYLLYFAQPDPGREPAANLPDTTAQPK